MIFDKKVVTEEEEIKKLQELDRQIKEGIANPALKLPSAADLALGNPNPQVSTIRPEITPGLQVERRDVFATVPPTTQVTPQIPPAKDAMSQLPPELAQHAADIFPRLQELKAKQAEVLKQSQPKENEIDRIRNIAIKQMEAEAGYKLQPNNIPLDYLETKMQRVKEQEQAAANKKEQAKRQEGLDLYEAQMREAQRRRLGLLPEKQMDFSKGLEMFPELKGMMPAPSETAIPFRPTEDTAEGKAAALTAKAVSGEAPKKEEVKQRRTPTRDKEFQQLLEKDPTKEPVPEELKQQAVKPSIEELMKQAEENENKAELKKSIAQFRDAIIGAGMGRAYKSDLSMYDEMIKDSKKPMQDLLLKQQIEGELAKSDPNSIISKLLRQSLATMKMDMTGLENVSYAQIEKIYPSLIQGLYNKLATEAKAIDHALSRQDQALRRQQVQQNAETTRDFRIDTHMTSLANKFKESKPLEAYNVAKSANDFLSMALTQKGTNAKIAQNTGFMQFAKTAQGDQSVVRSEDMKVLAGRLGLTPTELLDKLNNVFSGGTFTKNELKQMQQVVVAAMNAKKKQINTMYLNPMLKKAETYKYDMNLQLDPSFLEEMQTMELTPDQKASRDLQTMKNIEESLQQSEQRLQELRNKKGQ